MKTINKKIAIVLIILWTITYNAQQVLSLNTFLENIPANAHVKDLNNELMPYIGTYKANFEGNEITLFITKVEDKLEKSTNKNYYMDALVIQYIVKNSNGIILQDSQSTPNIELYSIGSKPAQNKIVFYYSGTNCNVGWGDIYLSKISASQILWDYRPNSIVLVNCPQNSDLTVYLPDTKNLIFNKQ